MPVPETNGSIVEATRRHPRLLRRVTWLRAHTAFGVTLGGAGILAVFVLDMSTDTSLMAGFYILPLVFLSVAVGYRGVAFAVAVCLLLAGFTQVWESLLDVNGALVLIFGLILGCLLVVLSYFIQRMATIGEYAILRAQLSEAGADILGGGRSRHDLDELLEYALERLGEQLDATHGLLLLFEDGSWQGRASFGLGADARVVVARDEEVPLATQAIRADAALARDFTGGDPSPLAPLAAHVRLERVLVLPMRALDREVGVMIFNRAHDEGEYNGEQIGLAEGIARYLGVTVDNVRLMNELDTRSRDLELVRDSSLDFAQSIDMGEVLEAVATRLVDALGMHGCHIYEVDPGRQTMRSLVSYDGGTFDAGERAGGETPLEQSGTSALALRSRRPVTVSSLSDPRLNDLEREQLQRAGHHTQLVIPLRIRDRVLAVVELLDEREGREFRDDEIDLARTICRFAALAIDKARLFDQQRATTERRDRLARRLHRLQTFAVDLNQRLDRTDLQEVLDEVTRAALDLLSARAAAVLAGSGQYLAVRSLAVTAAGPPASPAAVEADLLERCAAALAVPEDRDFVGGELVASPAGRTDGLLFAPLEGDPGQLGTVLVVADKEQGDFDEEDDLLIATLAAQLSTSLHNAISFQREHAIAETFQQALLMEPPVIPGIEVGVRYRAATDAARVGGDFYDLVTLAPGRLMVTVGDVCGKSLAAAAQSAVVRYMLRAYAAESSPGEALSRLNSTVIQETPNQPFVTLVVGYIDVTRHLFEYAVAGHPRPIVLAGRDEFPMPGEGNVPVGIFRGATYPTNRAVLPDDSCIVLYTDGFTEARRDGVLFGEERLGQAVRANLPLAAKDLAGSLLETVKEYSGGVLADDCAVVVVKLA